jgi:phosphatidylglycerol:prolipoprotein diacylglycerol transferase
LSLSVHPVQLYGSLKGLILFVLFSWLWKKNFFWPGGLFLLFWISYSGCRFMLKFFRGDDNRGWIGPFSTGQLMSLCIFSVSLAVLLGFQFGEKGSSRLKLTKKFVN